MIAANHPALGAARVSEGGARSLPVFEHIIMQPDPIRAIATPFVAPAQGEPAPPNRISPPIEAAPVSVSEPSSSGETSPSELPIQVSSIVDPVTGVIYAGYLTQDAQALYNSGSLLTGGNKLTPQGSALAAQGDLIQGTPAPSAAQIVQTQPATASASSWMDWLSEETIFSGYPNGAVAAVGVIALAWVFSGKKKGRR